MVKIKSDVDYSNMDKNMKRVADVVDEVYKEHTKKEATITSAREGEHRTDSLHYKGRALDFRTRDVKGDEKVSREGKINNIVEDIKNKLGEDYDVVKEETHIHIEYDPKGSTT